VVNFGPSQLQAKFKHAADFGVSGPWNRGSASAFEQALQAHVDDAAAMIINGTYRGQGKRSGVELMGRSGHATAAA
jgi:Colicin D